MCGAVEKEQGKVQVELDRCSVEAMRAEKRGRGGGVGGLYVGMFVRFQMLQG